MPQLPQSTQAQPLAYNTPHQKQRMMEDRNYSVMIDHSDQPLCLEQRLHKALVFNDEYYKDIENHDILLEMERKEREQFIEYNIRFVSVNFNFIKHLRSILDQETITS